MTRPSHDRNGRLANLALVRCAIYTRKSTEEGLEQEFNSLDAQRESGEAYIGSQPHEGWTACPTATTMAASPAATWTARPETPAGRHRGRQGRLRAGLQGRSPEPLPARLRQDDGDLRQPPRLVRVGHAAVQHRHLAWAGSCSTCCCPSPSSNARSSPSGRATRSPPLAARANGPAACRMLGYDVDPDGFAAGRQRRRGRARAGHLRSVPGARGLAAGRPGTGPPRLGQQVLADAQGAPSGRQGLQQD